MADEIGQRVGDYEVICGRTGTIYCPGADSSSAAICTAPPVEFIFLDQALNPFFLSTIS